MYIQQDLLGNSLQQHICSLILLHLISNLEVLVNYNYHINQALEISCTVFVCIHVVLYARL